MTKEQAIKILEKRLDLQPDFAWKYAGPDYRDQILGAETALNSLLGLDSWMTQGEAIDFAARLLNPTT